MKKLLTTITLSALVGTSAGNLKPMFAEKIVNTGFKSNQLNKEISNRSKNDNPFISKVNNLAGIIFNFPNGDIYLGALDSLYKSTDNDTSFQFAPTPQGLPLMVSIFLGIIYFYLLMQVHMLATIFNNCVVVHCFNSLTRVDNSVKEDY